MTKQQKNLRNRIKSGKDPHYSFATLDKPQPKAFRQLRQTAQGTQMTKQTSNNRLVYPLQLQSNMAVLKELES